MSYIRPGPGAVRPVRGSERGAVPGVDRAGQVSSAVPRPRQQPRSGGCGWWRRRRGGGVPQPKVWVRHVALTGASTSGPRPRAASAGPVHKTQYQQYSEQPPTSAASLLKMPARTITLKNLLRHCYDGLSTSTSLVCNNLHWQTVWRIFTMQVTSVSVSIQVERLFINVHIWWCLLNIFLCMKDESTSC